MMQSSAAMLGALRGEKPVHLRHLISEYLTDCRGRALSEETISNYTKALGVMAQLVGPSTPISAIRAETMRRACALLGERTLQRSSIAEYQKRWRTFWAWADGQGYVRSPMATIKRLKIHAADPVVLHEEEVQRLIDAVALLPERRQARDAALILLILDAGLRRGEVPRLRLADVNFETGQLFVQGKGDKDRLCYLGVTARTVLERYVKWYRRPGAVTDQLFVSAYGKALGRHGVYEIVRDLVQLAGLNKASVHTLRHTYATLAIRNGISTAALKLLLGHADLKTTERYVHLATYVHELARSPMDALNGK